MRAVLRKSAPDIAAGPEAGKNDIKKYAYLYLSDRHSAKPLN
jgi:hypothetical protein